MRFEMNVSQWMRRWWKNNVHNVDVHRLTVSFWSCISFIGFGVSFVVFAPTLLDIAHKLNVGVGILSVIFLVRAIGGVTGTVGSGILMDHFPKKQNALLGFMLFGGIVAISVVPVSVHIAMLGVVMFMMGVTLGGLDNGVHVILMRLWGDKSGPCMQFLHASFAFGAFIAPLIAKPFIQDIGENEDNYNTSLVFSIFCDIGNETTLCNETTSSVECVCVDTIVEACNGTVSEVVDIFYDDMYTNESCTLITVAVAEDVTLRFGWAYWISAIFLLIPFLAFIYFAIKYDLRCDLANSVQVQMSQESEEDEMNLIEESENVTSEANLAEGASEDSSKDELDTHTSQDNNETSSSSADNIFTPKTYGYPAFFILFCFMLCYVGSEVSYGSLVFTYAVEGQLQFGKQAAANVTAIFWGFFAFTRLFSVILALFKVRASIMMSMNISGSLIAIFILVVLPHNHIAIWIVSALLGASFASIYPTTMTWLSEHLPITGKATSVVVAGGNLGDILVPSAIAALVGNVNTDSFVYSIFSLIVTSTILIAVLFIMTAIYQRRHRSHSKTSKTYHKLDVVPNETDETIAVENSSLNSEPLVTDQSDDHLETTLL